MQQTESIKCIRHPNEFVAVVCVSEACTYESRLACFKCLLEYKSIEQFLDYRKFQLEIEDLARTVNENGNDFSQQLNQHFNVIGQDLMKKQFQFIIDLVKLFQTLKQALQNSIKQFTSYKGQVNILKKCYEQELNELNVKLNEIVEIEQYHSSPEWNKLESSISKYVNLYYKNTNVDVQKVMLRLNKPNESMLEVQKSIHTTCEAIQQLLDTLIKTQKEEMTFVNKKLTSPLITQEFAAKLLINIGQDKKFTRIFKGTVDGMTPGQFWAKCSNKGPTLTICKNKQGQVFGGYSPAKWVPNGQYQPDATMTSFIYSATKNQIYKIKTKEYAICCTASYGPTYGGGHDLNIAANFQEGYSNLGHSYDVTPFNIGTVKNTHLFGQTKPELTELEVYEVI